MRLRPRGQRLSVIAGLMLTQWIQNRLGYVRMKMTTRVLVLHLFICIQSGQHCQSLGPAWTYAVLRVRRCS